VSSTASFVALRVTGKSGRSRLLGLDHQLGRSVVRKPACQERCSYWPTGVECPSVTARSRERPRFVARAWPGLRSAGVSPRSRSVSGSGFTDGDRSRFPAAITCDKAVGCGQLTLGSSHKYPVCKIPAALGAAVGGSIGGVAGTGSRFAGANCGGRACVRPEARPP
jgi:hypothetical protein